MQNGHEAATLAAEVYGVVRRRILRGDLVPGHPISRRKVAEELRMSLLPVGDALRRLEFEGLLESRPRAGTRVRMVSADDVRGHYVLREALEVQAAMRFAVEASPRERNQLKALAVRVDALAVLPDRHAYVSLHHRFHRRIAECCRCPALSEAIENTQALAMLWFSLMREPSPTDSRTRHQELSDALGDGGPEAAAAAVREHIAVGMQRTLDILEPYFRMRAVRGATFSRIGRRAGGKGLPQ